MALSLERRAHAIPVADPVLIGIAAVGVSLRCWDLGAARLSFDETFTAVAARLPVGALFTYLRRTDAHPPLDYLVRAPLARAGASEAWLRAPSALASVAALVVAALWWRSLGRTGRIATALLAVSSFAITYAHDARMYAALSLAGVVVGAAAMSWLTRPTRAALGAMGCALLAALWLQGGAPLVVPAVIAVAGLRRDRAAWAWRATALAAFAVWAAAWGGSFLAQLHRTGHSWVPLTSPHYALVVVNELVDSTPMVAALVCVMVVAGCCTVPRGPARTVVVSLGAGVLVTYLVFGVHYHVLLPRSLAFVAWAPLLALASLIDAAARRSLPLGAALAALVMVVVVPSSLASAAPVHAPHAAAFSAVRADARVGDTVAISPPFLWTMPAWYFGVRWWPHGTQVTEPALQAQGTVIGGGRPDGRTWLVVSVAYPAVTGGLQECGPPRRLDGFTVYCLEAHGAG